MKRGFTLIELLVVLAILLVVSALAIPYLQSFQVSSNLYTQAATLNQTLRRARQQAVAGQNTSSWGVYFDNNNKQFILFKGESFINREPAADQVTVYPSVFNISSDFGSEINFSVFSGQPSASGTIQIFGPDSQSQKVLINNYGKIELGG